MDNDNFNVVIRRMNSYKWNGLKYSDTISLDIADMDFKLSDELLKPIHERINQGIFGYEFEGPSYYDAFIQWMRKNHNIDIKENNIICTAGVMYGIKTAISAFVDAGDTVLVQIPGYNAYCTAIENNGRRIAKNELIYKNGVYKIDFDDFENKIRNNNVKLFILCNPHNPVGRVWNAQEMQSMVNICRKYSVLILSDEVYQDYIFENIKFNSCIQFKDQYDKIIVVTSPCKTFNVAGLHIANLIIPDDKVRRIFDIEKRKKGYISNNALGIAMCENLYRNGYNWHNESFRYIKKNMKCVKNFFNQKYPEIKVVDSEALYLLWIDFRCLNMSDSRLEEMFVDEMHLKVGNGLRFGENAGGFVRINVACPNCFIIEAIKRMDKVLEQYYHKG